MVRVGVGFWNPDWIRVSGHEMGYSFVMGAFRKNLLKYFVQQKTKYDEFNLIFFTILIGSNKPMLLYTVINLHEYISVR